MPMQRTSHTKRSYPGKIILFRDYKNILGKVNFKHLESTNDRVNQSYNVNILDRFGSHLSNCPDRLIST